MVLQLSIPGVGEGEGLPFPKRCPACGNDTWHSHGWVKKSVREPQAETIRIQRIQCTRCGKTLRLYPPGLGRGAQSEQLRSLSAFLWSLGASYRSIEETLVALGYRLRHSSICQSVRRLLAAPPWWLGERLPTRRIDLLDIAQSAAWVEDTGGILLLVRNSSRQALIGLEVREGEDPEALSKAVSDRFHAFLASGFGDPEAGAWLRANR